MKRNLTAKEIKMTEFERKLLPWQRKVKANYEQYSRKPYRAHFIRKGETNNGLPVYVTITLWATSNKDAERKARRLEKNRYRYTKNGVYRNLKLTGVNYDAYRIQDYQTIYYRAPICRFIDCDCKDCRNCDPRKKAEEFTK